MSLDLASKNRQNKGGTGRGKNTGRGSCRPSILAFGDGFHPKILKHREMAGKGCARCPHNPKLKPNSSLIPGPVAACAQHRLQLCACFYNARGWKRSPGKGMFFPPRRAEEGVGEQPENCFRFGSLPRISAAPVHVSLSAGKGERNREVSPRGGQSECASAPQR